jgi:hypothetical protein
MPGMKDQLLDFKYLTLDLNKHPTSISELVPDHPVAVGSHNASGEGMGGIWLPAVTNLHLEPTLWLSKFPHNITMNWVSFDNPNGTINNSQLELAGGIAHNDVLQQLVTCTCHTVVPLGNNTAATAWQHKGSATSNQWSYGIPLPCQQTAPASLSIPIKIRLHYQYLSKADYIWLMTAHICGT